MRLVGEAKYDLVVMSDSDVRVDPDYLRQLCGRLPIPKLGRSPLLRCITGGSVAADLAAPWGCIWTPLPAL